MSSYFENDEQIGGGDASDDDDDDDTSSTSSSSSEDIGGGVNDKDLDDGLIGGGEVDEEVGEEEEDADLEDDEEDDDDQEGGGDSDEGEMEEGEDEEESQVVKSGEKNKKVPSKTIVKKAFVNDDSEDEDDDDDGEMYLKKFDTEINDNYILNFHPECAVQNYDEILAMTKVVRDSDNIIIDDLHKTNPFLTKYERARILGQRAKQIESGATSFVKIPENIIDGYLIAELELQQSRIPFIIRRPLPNGGSEYWKISDLENIAF